MRDVFPGTEPVTRVGSPVADETALAAVPARIRRDGQSIELTTLPGAQYVWRQESTSPATPGSVVVPHDISVQAAYIANPASVPGRWENQSVLGTSELPRLAARLAQSTNFAATRVGNTLTANAPGALANIDSTAPALGNRILYFGQTAGQDNGVYALTSLGSVSTPAQAMRVADLNQSAEAVTGMSVSVTEGVNYGGQSFTLTTLAPITLNTTVLTFAQKSNLITVTATVSLAQLQAVGAAKIYNFSINANAVPPGARYAGGEVADTALIDDPTHGTAVLDLGWSGTPQALTATMDVSAATGTGFPKPPAGASAYAGGSAVAGKVLLGKITTGANMNTLTAGGLTVTLRYTVGG